MSKKEVNVGRLPMHERAGIGSLYGLTAEQRLARSRAASRTFSKEDYENDPVKQSFKDEVDINNIIAKYSQTGVLPEVRDGVAQYLDMTKIPNYEKVLNTVIQAQELFDSLPADVRYRFRNDPGQMLDFFKDDKNYDEAVKLGLLDEQLVSKRRLSKEAPVASVSDLKTSDPAPKGGQPGSPAAGEGGSKT